MSKKVFITKREAKKLANDLRIAYHRCDRHLGLNVKIYNFPKDIKNVLNECLSIHVAFDMFFGTLLSEAWNLFATYMKSYGYTAYSSGQSGGYWGTSLEEYDDEKKVKRAMRKSFYQALIDIFNYSEVELFSLGMDLDRRGKAYIYLTVTKNVNGRYHIYSDGVEEWIILVNDKIVPLFEKEDINFNERWSKIASYYNNFAKAWSLKSYVCAS